MKRKAVNMPIVNSDHLRSPLYKPTVHITTHNTSGKATVHTSTKNPAKALPDHGLVVTQVYTTSSFPPNLNDEIDMKQHMETIASGKLGIVKPKGTVVRFADFAPFDPDVPVMHHRTQSLDYGIVLEGDMAMDLDDGSSTLLTKGDIVVQRGTMHAWRNASTTQWARMLFILQDCQPLVLNGQRLKEDLGNGTISFLSSGNDT